MSLNKQISKTTTKNESIKKLKLHLKTGSVNVIVPYTCITQAKTEGQMIRGQPGLQRETLVIIEKTKNLVNFLHMKMPQQEEKGLHCSWGI